MVHGWLILNKPSGITSTQAGSIVKRVLGVKKLGHAGTLDPLATGVLPLALGEATKTIPYVMDTQKGYRFQVTWGEQRSTDDMEGEVITTSTVRPTYEEIMQALPQFRGVIQQRPPAYSAIKINGVRSYDLARSGAAVDLKPRQVCIHNLQLLSIDSINAATFMVDCSKGTYVRSIARDLALTLGTYGYISQLQRTKVGKFTLNDAISLEKIRQITHISRREEFIHCIRAVLDDIPAVPISDEQVHKVRQGQSLLTDLKTAALVALYQGEQLVAIASMKAGRLYPKKVFNAIF
jgi:tRNA pseudouridine55 synthase